MPRDEVEAAYFTLLRAREEHAALQRYEEYLRAERQRLQRTSRERQAALATVDRRMGRTIRATDQALEEASLARQRVIDDELARVPERLDAATAYVAECEAAHLARREGR